jgi:nitrous oxidase accessory protein NosD
MQARMMGTGLLAAAVVAAAAPPPAAARTLRVSAAGLSCPRAAFTRVQTAIDAAQDGDKIVICSGVYDEQVVVDKDITVRARPGAVLRPTGMVANTTSIRTGRLVAAVVTTTDRGVLLHGLEIDASAHGLGCDAGDPVLVGVFFRGVSGALKKSTVRGTRFAGDASCDSGAAVLAQAVSSATMVVSLAGNRISDYQRAGIVVNERGAHAEITRNTISGLGATAQTAQNGIQVGFGAVARITKNVVEDNAAPTAGTCAFDGGNLVFASDGGVVADNTFRGNTAGVFISGDKNRIGRNLLDGSNRALSAGLDGIVVFGDENLLVRNEIRNMSAVGVRVLGNGNRIRRNTIIDTQASRLCDAARLTPGCEDILAVCGVGLWIAEGFANDVDGNAFLGNDVDVIDQGTATAIRGGR